MQPRGRFTVRTFRRKSLYISQLSPNFNRQRVDEVIEQEVVRRVSGCRYTDASERETNISRKALAIFSLQWARW